MYMQSLLVTHEWSRLEMIVGVFLNRAHPRRLDLAPVYCVRGHASMLQHAGIEPTDLDLSPSPRADYRQIKMEEDVRSAVLSRYYKESKFDSPSLYSIFLAIIELLSDYCLLIVWINLCHHSHNMLSTIVHHTMLQYQSYTLGLFPRGHSGHARVRDNVYCALALWAFSMAYRWV